MRYFIELAYNGTPFYGWQIQPKQITVQEVVEKGLTLLLDEKISIMGCGRTDTGVHAKKYFAHFDYSKIITEKEVAKLIYKLNSFLPKEIVINKIFEVPETFHARFDAIERIYRYYISLEKNPFHYQLSHRVFVKIDIELMQKAASLLIGNKDFTSFSKVDTAAFTNICNVTFASFEFIDNQLVFTITANRFLRNMVRAIVGTLIWVGTHKITIQQFEDIINQKDRCKAGMSAPAYALFLEDVRYDFDFKNQN